MKIIWVVNIVFPKLAKELNISSNASGTWLIDLADRISMSDDVDLCIMSYYGGTSLVDMEIDNIRYLLFPGGSKRLLYENKKTLKDCKKAIDLFKPDLIHIHGTEYAPGYEMLQVSGGIPTLLTIQGIIKRISEEYFGGLSVWKMFKMSSLKELLTLRAPIYKKTLYKRNAKREERIIKSVKYATGRTDWDKGTMQQINPNIIYFRCNYNLPDPFYMGGKWDIEKIQRHLIVSGAALYSLKGLHILIQALAIVKKSYPDVKLEVPGGNAKNGRIVNPSGYIRYINRLINQLDLNDNVIFIGKISSAQVADNLRRAHCCVIPSAIEGASASLREAMMIGTPSVCSYRGGMTELLYDERNGFTYDYPEVAMLAMKIIRIFEDDDLAQSFSKEAIKDAEIRHDRQKNPQDMINVYRKVIEYEKAGVD